MQWVGGNELRGVSAARRACERRTALALPQALAEQGGGRGVRPSSCLLQRDAGFHERLQEGSHRVAGLAARVLRGQP